jgi:hypothetical protein
VLVITAAVCGVGRLRAIHDHYEVIVILAGLLLVHALLSGRSVSAHWNLAFTAPAPR